MAYDLLLNALNDEIIRNSYDEERNGLNKDNE